MHKFGRDLSSLNGRRDIVTALMMNDLGVSPLAKTMAGLRTARDWNEKEINLASCIIRSRTV